MYNRVVKRLFDLLFGIIALPFFGLACLIIVPLIKTHDKGPAFYNAPRVGQGGRLFKMYKFRTMQVNAPDLKMPDGSTYNAPDDPRMTLIGKRLRSWSLDELPQILNIIKGDMSFIGPRPDLEEEAALYQGDEKRKLEVRPGISGYAQVYGRNAILWHERLALDVEYVTRIGFVLDLHIFLRTFVVIFKREGVYVDDAASAPKGDARAFAAAQDESVSPAPSAGSTPFELVSLVVVARDEEEYLPGLLDDIIVQDYPHGAIELLLVDSNAGANAAQRELMEQAVWDLGDFARVAVLDNPDGFLPHGCNVALDAFEGEVFLRVDAHARIPADFVRRTVEVLGEGHMVCGGLRPVVLEDATDWGQTLLAAETSVLGASPARYRRAQRGCEVSSVFHGGYRSEVFEDVGLYDERLLRTEDNDFSQRLREAGYHIWMDPRICSWQYLRPGFWALLRQKAANGYWIGRTLLLKPRAVGLMHFVPFAFVLALLVSAALGVLSWLPLATLGYVYGLVSVALLVALVVKRVFGGDGAGGADGADGADGDDAEGLGDVPPQMLALPLVLLSMHVSYGAGTLVGLVRGAFLGKGSARVEQKSVVRAAAPAVEARAVARVEAEAESEPMAATRAVPRVEAEAAPVAAARAEVWADAPAVEAAFEPALEPEAEPAFMADPMLLLEPVAIAEPMAEPLAELLPEAAPVTTPVAAHKPRHKSKAHKKSRVETTVKSWPEV